MKVIDELMGMDGVVMLANELSLVDDSLIDRYGTEKLTAKEDGDKELGKIRLLSTKRLWIVRASLRRRMAGMQTQLGYDLMTAMEKSDLEDSIGRSNQLEELVTELFWYQTRSEIANWRVQPIGVRQDWLVVQITQKPRMNLFGPFQVPDSGE